MGNAPFDKKNPHFGSSYASLASVLDTVRSALAKNGLIVTNTLSVDSLTVTLAHSSGQWVDSTCRLPQFAKAQELGSFLSYMRRYMISALLNVSADEDDDGNAAQSPSNTSAAPAPQKRAVANPGASTPVPKAAAPVVSQAKPSTPDVTRSKVMAAAQAAGWAPESVTRFITAAYGVSLVRELKPEQVEYLIKVIGSKSHADAMAFLETPKQGELDTSFNFGENAPTRIGS
jgi:hypothetical protein